MKRLHFVLPLSVLVLVSLGCDDPIKDAAIEALGGELDGVEESEFHRPGQPCLACHSIYGGDDPVMSIGGTVFSDPDEGEIFPVASVTVRISDSEGEVREAITNCIGNFFFTKDEWDPAYPLRAELLVADPDDPGSLLVNAPMVSRIGREGSCAGCHSYPAAVDSPGLVHVVGPGFEPPTAECEGIP